jgi:hypothetical protein
MMWMGIRGGLLLVGESWANSVGNQKVGLGQRATGPKVS